jgi:phosphoglycolate phosphatase
MTAPQIQVAVLDMAGTTIADNGVVEASFTSAMNASGIRPGTDAYAAALDYVRETMGRSKIEVFRHLLQEEDAAQRANATFETAYADHVLDGEVKAIAGARETVELLQGNGVRVALTTGFAAVTRDLILDAIGWTDVADLVLAPSDAGRGRPYPDMNLVAMMRLGGHSVSGLLVAGDTGSDMDAATNAGAALRVGVLSGAGDEAELRTHGATHVIEDITSLPGLLAFT